MIKLCKRATALLLTAVLLISLVACGPGNNNSSGSGTPKTDQLKYKDLNGYNFTVIDFNDGRWNKDKSGTPYLDAWQDMMNNVEQKYNCKITKLPKMAPGDIITKAQPEIAAGGKFADLICTTQWAYGYFIGAGLMLDLNKLKVNWNAKWWNQNMRQMSTIAGKTYAACGSFIFDAQSTWMIYYNQDIWNELKLPDPYKLVDSGKWTIDKFNDYAQMALRDMDGNGLVDSLDDRWGIIAPGGDFARALYLGGGNHFFEEKNGKVQLAMDNTATYDFVTKMRQLNVEKKAFCNVKVKDVPAFVDLFKRNKALFFSYMPGVNGLQDMDSDWGVLPMPKASESQKDYLSGIDHNSTVCGVTNTNTNIEPVSYIMDALGYYGLKLEDIYWPDYKETYWRHENLDANVIKKYVAHHGQSDIAQLMQNVQPNFMAPLGILSKAFGGSIVDLSSAVESQKPVIDQAVQDYFSGKSSTTTAAPAA